MIFGDDDEPEQHDDELLLDMPLHDEEEGQAEEEIVLELEDDDFAEKPDDDATVKKLRKIARDAQRDTMAARRDAAEARKANAPKPVDVGPEPVWEDNENTWEWSGTRFAQAHHEWKERKREAEQQANQQTEAQRAQSQEFERARTAHMQRAAKLSISADTFAALEKNVSDAIGSEMLGAALILAKDSARLVAAIGGKPELLAKLADEPNPLVKLKMLRDWEEKIVTRRNAPPPPEAPTIQRGSASLARPNAGKELDKLEKEAERTGDRTKIIAFKREQKAKEAARR